MSASKAGVMAAVGENMAEIRKSNLSSAERKPLSSK
jgi:hypothetical protein